MDLNHYILEKFEHQLSFVQMPIWKRIVSSPKQFFKRLKTAKADQVNNQEFIANHFLGFPMKVSAADTDLLKYGLYLDESTICLTKYFISNITPKSVFIEVGAHAGFFSILAAQLVTQEGRVLSIEPSQNAFVLLEGNTHQFSQITNYNIAIGPKDEMVSFRENEADKSFLNQIVTTFTDQDTIVEVYANKLDTFLKGQKVTPQIIFFSSSFIDFKFLEDSIKTVSMIGLQLVFSYKAFVGGERILHLDSFLSSYGYQPFAILPDGTLENIAHLNQYLQALTSGSVYIVFKNA